MAIGTVATPWLMCVYHIHFPSGKVSRYPLHLQLLTKLIYVFDNLSQQHGTIVAEVNISASHIIMILWWCIWGFSGIVCVNSGKGPCSLVTQAFLGKVKWTSMHIHSPKLVLGVRCCCSGSSLPVSRVVYLSYVHNIWKHAGIYTPIPSTILYKVGLPKWTTNILHFFLVLITFTILSQESCSNSFYAWLLYRECRNIL